MTNLPAPETETYNLALRSLLGLIRGERFASRSQASRRKRAVAKLTRIGAMLGDLGDPHRRYPIVHVTGTSGKGSTAATIAAILTAAGYRAGLRTSPYLQVATEKLQIGPSLIDAASFEESVRLVLAEASHLSRSDHLNLPFSYAEAWALLSFLWFAERDVDVAVVEVGAGGRFDATNVIDPIVSVITTVGLDHVVSLGPTISDIAWHKAGIIKPGSTAVLGRIPDAALEIVVREAQAVGAQLVRAQETDVSKISLPSGWSGFRRQNAEVAAAVAETLRRNGFEIPDAAIVAGMRTMRLPGRLERMPCESAPEVWIDGAHNGDKVGALAREFVRMFQGGPLPVIVLGMLDAKDPATIVSELRGLASSMVLTEPVVVGREALKPELLREVLLASGFGGAIYVEPHPDTAVQCAEALAKYERTTVLVTGSMYLAGLVRGRWYRDEEIVIQRTPWPSRARGLGAS